jgi:hypothetical protein
MSLFTITPANACLTYKYLQKATQGHSLGGRQHCDDLWRDFARHADPNFAEEFSLHLHERWFEMYFTVALLRARLNVTCLKPGPDVLVTLANGTRIWIEAICATAGVAGLPDSVPAVQCAAIDRPLVVTARSTEQMTLRICNALSSKAAVFRRYLAERIVLPTDLFAIAINVHAVPNLWADMGDLMMRALYGVGDLVLTVSRDTGAIIGSRHDELTHIAKNRTGALVGVQPFIDGSLSHISAVIGSRADAVNLPRRLGDDLMLFPNLTATVPWVAGTVRRGEEWSFAPVSNGWDGERVSYVT